MVTTKPNQVEERPPERPWNVFLSKPTDGLVTYRLQVIAGMVQAAHRVPDLSLFLNDVEWKRVFRHDTIDPLAAWDRRHTTVFRIFCETTRVARRGRIKVEVRADGKPILQRILRCAFDGPLDHRPLIYCIHIPKTAGTSLRAALRASGLHVLGAYHEPCGLPSFVDPREFGSFSTEAFDDLDLVMGHVAYGLHRHSHRPYKYISVIRRPETFLKSYYLFRKYVQKSAKLAAFASIEAAIEAAIEANVDAAFDNLFTRWIAGYAGRKPVDQNIFRRACDNIVRDFAYIGTTEDVASSFERIGSYLGVRLDPVAENPTPAVAEGATIDPSALLTRFRSRMTYDLALYDFVVDRFGRSSSYDLPALPPRRKSTRLSRRFVPLAGS